MFDLSDNHTKTVMATALAESRRFGHNWLGTEHILIALTIHRSRLPEPVARLLPSTDQVRETLNATLGHGPTLPDAALLGTLGIDLNHVRAAVRETFGDEALDRLARRRVHQPWQPWRRPHRACVSLLAGHQSVAPRLKRAFEHARHTVTAESQQINPTALLLGILEVEDALANQLLDNLGIAPSDLRATLQGTAS